MKYAESAGLPTGVRRPARERLRWWIAGLLFISTIINYMDRQNLSILARTIQDDLKISDIQYSYVVQAFLFAYTLTYVVAGRLTDWLGSRISMALFVCWWSIADALTSLSYSAVSLGFFRFLLGVGEPGNYTAAPKAVSEWFEPREQGLVIGFYTAGATIGAALAPPLVAISALHFGWRLTFVCTGGLGLLWLIPWLLISKLPKSEEVSYSETLRPQSAGWGIVLRRRETWQLLLARLFTDPVWYFYLFWFPKYLTDTRHLGLIAVSRIVWVVYLAADLGCLAAGYFSALMIRKGVAPAKTRIRLMTLSVLFLPLSPFVALAPNAGLAVFFASMAAFGHLVWQTSLSSIILDLYPRQFVGLVFGIVAAGSGLGGMLSTGLIGFSVTHYSYTPLFFIMGVVHPLSLLLILPIKRKTMISLS